MTCNGTVVFQFILSFLELHQLDIAGPTKPTISSLRLERFRRQRRIGGYLAVHGSAVAHRALHGFH